MNKNITLKDIDFDFIQKSNIYLLGKDFFGQKIIVPKTIENWSKCFKNIKTSDFGEGSLTVNYVTEFNIKPLFKFEDEKNCILIRHSQIVDFNTLKQYEPTIFQLTSKPVVLYQLMVCKKLTDKETEELKQLIQTAHKNKFNVNIKHLTVSSEDWDQEIDQDEIDDYLESVYAENK